MSMITATTTAPFSPAAPRADLRRRTVWLADPSQMLAAMWIDHLGSHPSRNGFGAAG